MSPAGFVAFGATGDNGRTAFGSRIGRSLPGVIVSSAVRDSLLNAFPPAAGTRMA